MGHQIYDVNQDARSPIRLPLVRWSPPPVGCNKGNFDAAIFDGLDCAGVGVVFRDSFGNVIAALIQLIGHAPSVDLAEALAARRAVALAKELSLFDVIVEGDCLRIVQALKKTSLCKTLLRHIVKETKRLGSTLRRCHFQHFPRERNRLAHGLARRAVLSVDSSVWVDELPVDLEDVFQSDFV